MHALEYGVVPVAGYGLRLSGIPRARPIPKAMLPLVGRFAVEYPIETLRQLGVRKVCFIVGPEPEFSLLTQFLGDGREWGMSFSYVEQRERRGVAHAVALARDAVQGPFAVVLGDDLTISDTLGSGLDLFFEQQAIALEFSIAETDSDSISRSCIIQSTGDGRITDIVEKPITPQPGLRGIGIYLFTPELFNYISRTETSRKTGQIELTDTIRIIAGEGRAFTREISGININLNTALDLAKACSLLTDTLVRQHVEGQ